MLNLPYGTKITQELGDSLDYNDLQKRFVLPNSKKYRYVKFYNQRTGRWSQAFICDHEDCGKVFRKWHNLFDHLRIHTKERPFLCPDENCPQTFTQLSNLNKHLSTHKK